MWANLRSYQTFTTHHFLLYTFTFLLLILTPYLTARSLYPPLIHKRPSPLLGIVVVIPCYDEELLLLSLMSLMKCERPNCDVEVIVIINQSEKTPEPIKITNQKTYEQAIQWAQKNRPSHLRFRILFMEDLPPKHAGVGLARKIGMDEACYRFEKMDNPNGIIACFDADSRCEKNYLQAIEAYFSKNPKAQACGLHFEHPISGPDYDENIYEAITLYELHLRYYVHAQRWAGYPNAWQTIGSSMAVRCNSYQQQGGMNRRQAGEDFYFLHKFIPLGNYGEITETTVIPSPRPSNRVPFGTGKAVGELLKKKGKYLTYNPLSFEDLSVFLQSAMPKLYDATFTQEILNELPQSIQSFLTENKIEEKIQEAKLHTSNLASFEKRMWRWFDAFLLMKYMHFARDNFYPDIEVGQAAKWLLNKTTPVSSDNLTAKDLLLIFRKMDKSGSTS